MPPFSFAGLTRAFRIVSSCFQANPSSTWKSTHMWMGWPISSSHPYRQNHSSTSARDFIAKISASRSFSNGSLMPLLEYSACRRSLLGLNVMWKE